jgi:hypothetical protein
MAGSTERKKPSMLRILGIMQGLLSGQSIEQRQGRVCGKVDARSQGKRAANA